MKKNLIIIVILIILCGCHNNKKMEHKMKLATDSYYNNYISGKVKGLDTLEITLGDLRSLKASTIDLSALNKCDDSTSVVATIENNKIVDYQININLK